MMKYGNIRCFNCGCDFYGPLSGTLYCKSCRKIINHQNDKKSKNKAEVEKRNKVREITKLADAEGLSYGKYCLKYGI